MVKIKTHGQKNTSNTTSEKEEGKQLGLDDDFRKSLGVKNQ